MVVETLGHQHLGQFSLLARAFLNLGPFVLKPDFNLVFIQTQLHGQILSPLFGEISIVIKLLFQSSQLFG